MSVKLREVVFQVRCTEPGCSFNADFSVKENIMAATEADVDTEAWKLAKNQAYIKHDALFGRRHPLVNPEIHKISGRYDQIGASHAAANASAAASFRSMGSSPSRRYARGEKIIRKGESAVTVCEIVRGYAYNERRPDVVYRPGSTFGAAALLQNKNRLADIVAGEDDTIVCFYNLRDLTRSNPAKARELYNAAMEDIFHVLAYLEEYSATLEKQIDRMKKAKPVVRAAKPPKRAARPKPKAVKKAAKKAGPAKTAKAKRAKPVKRVKKSPAKKR